MYIVKGRVWDSLTGEKVDIWYAGNAFLKQHEFDSRLHVTLNEGFATEFSEESRAIIACGFMRRTKWHGVAITEVAVEMI